MPHMPSTALGPVSLHMEPAGTTSRVANRSDLGSFLATPDMSRTIVPEGGGVPRGKFRGSTWRGIVPSHACAADASGSTPSCSVGVLGRKNKMLPRQTHRGAFTSVTIQTCAGSLPAALA